MAEAVCRRYGIAEAWVVIKVRPYEICGGRSGSGTQFDPSTSVSPCSRILRKFDAHHQVHIAVTRVKDGRSLRTFKKQQIS
jgi:hypothetical protein